MCIYSISLPIHISMWSKRIVCVVTVSALLTQLLCYYCILGIELLLTGLLCNMDKLPAKGRKEIRGLPPGWVEFIFYLSTREVLPWKCALMWCQFREREEAVCGKRDLSSCQSVKALSSFFPLLAGSNSCSCLSPQQLQLPHFTQGMNYILKL